MNRFHFWKMGIFAFKLLKRGRIKLIRRVCSVQTGGFGSGEPVKPL